MGEKLYFQTIVQFTIDTETGKTEVLKKFTTEFKGKHQKKTVTRNNDFGKEITQEVEM